MEQIIYRLTPGLKVRKELFGLLFYNARDTKLTFVKSVELLDDQALSVEKDVLRFARDSSKASKKIEGILNELVKRGILLESGLSVQ